MTASNIATKYVIRNYGRPADGETLPVSATLKRRLPKVTINPVSVVDRAKAAGGSLIVSGRIENVLTSRPITFAIGGNPVSAFFTGGTRDWTANVPSTVRNSLSGDVAINVSITDIDGNVSSESRVVSFDPNTFQIAPLSDFNRDGKVYSDELTGGSLAYRIDIPDTFLIGDTITVRSSTERVSERIIDQTLLNIGYFVVEVPKAGEGEDFTLMATKSDGGWGLAVVAERILVEDVADGEETGYGYGYGGSELCVGQKGKNPTCIHPVRCPVTFPHYGTPRFTDSSIAGIPFSTLAIPLPANANDEGCTSLWSRPLHPVWPASGLTLDSYANAPTVEWPLGSIAFAVGVEVPYLVAFHAWISSFDANSNIVWNKFIGGNMLLPTGSGLSGDDLSICDR